MKDLAIIYQAKNGALELKGDVTHNTIWASQKQLAEVFSVDVRTVNEHIQNIYTEKELSKTATIRNFRIVQTEGSRSVTRTIEHYNLDAIISVGYRVNSKTATKFRQWATKTLRTHITEGFTINPKLIKQNLALFTKALKDIGILLPHQSELTSTDVLDVVQLFAKTWFSLDAYDKGTFGTKTTKKNVHITGEDLAKAIETLKQDLVRKKQASALFAQPKYSDAVVGIVGNVFQVFDGADVYPSVEEKAAHLLYFMVKNHPFTDGNKRCGAFAFVWFLREAGVLTTSTITPEGLTALTLLIAESNPKEKDRMVGLVLLLLGQ